MASLWDKLRETYVLSIRNQKNFFESSKASLSVAEMLSILLVFCLLIFVLSFLLFKFTSFGYLVGDQSQGKEKIILLNERADSLESTVSKQKNYIENIQNIIAGVDLSEIDGEAIDSQEIENISISEQSDQELAMIDKVNQREQLTLKNNENIELLDFQLPVEGVVSSEFDLKDNHFGIDIVAPQNTAIKAIANGKVLYSSWSIDDGYSMILLHDNDFVSIYKHAEKLLKETNDNIENGEAIAIIGNSGENTTGYHLHFELWSDGMPVNPEDYINLQ